MNEKDKEKLYLLMKKLKRKRIARLNSAGKIKKGGFDKGIMKRTQKPVGKSVLLLFFGIISIVFSLILNSTILVFLGLSLTFWGFLFLFVLPSKYVKSEVLDSMAFSSLSAISKIIADSNCQGKVVYLPPYPKDVYIPGHLKEIKEGLVFIPAINDKVESVIEQAFVKNPKGMHIIPPGLGLANLFEKKLGMDLFKTDLDFLIDKLPNVLVDDLGIANEFKIKSDKDLVHVEISKPVCEDLCKEASKLMNICSNLGCPLSSSIAFILAKVTSRPVVIERCELKNGVIAAWYRILKG